MAVQPAWRDIITHPRTGQAGECTYSSLFFKKGLGFVLLISKDRETVTGSIKVHGPDTAVTVVNQRANQKSTE
jgi:hypothetical protein